MMSPIHSAQGAAYAGGMGPVVKSSSKSSLQGGPDETASKPAGMESALMLLGEYVRKLLRENGMVDIQASNVQMIEAFTEYEPPAADAMDVGLDPITATRATTRMGALTPEDMNQVLRIVGSVDPERAAALLK